MKQMKKNFILYSTLICFAITLLACGSPDYSEENFDHFKSIAESNGSQAIQELRYFVHYNPEHAEGNLLLAKLLMEHAQTDRDYFLAQHYLKEAISYAEDTKFEDLVIEISMQIKLLRGATPGDPQQLIKLAQFAQKNNRLDLAVQNYIKAAEEFLFLTDTANAHNCAKIVADLSIKLIAEGKIDDGDEFAQHVFVAYHILATTYIIQSEYESSNNFSKSIREPSIQYEPPEFLPDISFIHATTEVMSKISRPGLSNRLTFWRESEKIDEKIDIEKLENSLGEANKINSYTRDITRDWLSKMIWESILNDIDKSKASSIAGAAEYQVHFYSERIESE